MLRHPDGCGCGGDHAPLGMLSTNAASRVDPTNTGLVRAKFEAEVNRRFKKLLAAVHRKLVTEDYLAPVEIRVNREIYGFPRSEAKAKGFMKWLNSIEADLIYGRGASAKKGVPWMNTYVQTAYRKGINMAGAELRGAGVKTATPQWLEAAFVRPVHADLLASLYTRNFTLLENITRTMDQEISAVLSQGMADGRGVMDIARDIQDRVEKIGRTRARTIARTEIIRAHADATVATYREAGVEGVKIRAEFSTSRDNKVCEECAALEGRTFKLDEIEGMIPIHPNCRCGLLPVVALADGSAL